MRSTESTFASRRCAIAAATIGNALDWFDFTVFAFLAIPISKAFFAAQDETTALLSALAAFGVGFLARPIGGVLFGRYADRVGRKAALVANILLMTAGTGVIALIPGYNQIGIYAPVLVVFARVTQGLAVGGEFGRATAFLVESAPPDRRGFYASLQMAGQYGSRVLGGVAAALVTGLLTTEQVEAWGWRLPFVFGLLIGPVGLYLRSIADEPPEFVLSRTTNSPSALVPLRNPFRGFVASFGVATLGAASVYVVVIHMPTFATKQLGIAPFGGFLATTVASAVGLTLCPAMGALSDKKKIGHSRMMAMAVIVIGIAAYPLFLVLATWPTVTGLVVVQVCFAILLVGYVAPIGAVMSDMFPVRARSTGLSVGYNLAVIAFGGFAPFVVTWLIAVTRIQMVPAFYIVVAAAIALATLLTSGLGVSRATSSGDYINQTPLSARANLAISAAAARILGTARRSSW